MVQNIMGKRTVGLIAEPGDRVEVDDNRLQGVVESVDVYFRLAGVTEAWYHVWLIGQKIRRRVHESSIRKSQQEDQ